MRTVSHHDGRRHSAPDRAMTVMELLVAVGITVVLVGLLLAVVTNTLGLWNRSAGLLSTSAQARVILDQVARDVESAVIRRDGSAWLAATIQRDQTSLGGDSGMSIAAWTESGGNVKPTAAAGSLALFAPAASASPDNWRFGQAGMWLRLVATDSGSNTTQQATSAPTIISYQVVRARLSGNTKTDGAYYLFRNAVRPSHATATTAARSSFALGFDVFAAAYNDPAAPNASSGAGEPGGTRRPDRSLLIGTNVIDFGVRLYNAAGVRIFPTGAETSPVTFAAARTPRPTGLAAAPSNSGAVAYGEPTEIEVFVRILTPEGANRVLALELGNVTPPTGSTFASEWWRIAEQDSRVFVRRLPIRQTAP